MKYDVITVADRILKTAKLKSAALTPLQLMKLVYIAHGWHLALFDSDLFSNKIEAWKYGPVIPDLYHATKSFGRSPIPLNIISDDPAGVDDLDRAFLDDVYEKYGHLTGIQLSSLTHQAGTPWDQVYEDGVRSKEISDSLLNHHYKGLLNDHDLATAA